MYQVIRFTIEIIDPVVDRLRKIGSGLKSASAEDIIFTNEHLSQTDEILIIEARLCTKSNH